MVDIPIMTSQCTCTRAFNKSYFQKNDNIVVEKSLVYTFIHKRLSPLNWTVPEYTLSGDIELIFNELHCTLLRLQSSSFYCATVFKTKFPVWQKTVLIGLYHDETGVWLVTSWCIMQAHFGWEHYMQNRRIYSIYALILKWILSIEDEAVTTNRAFP